MTSAAPTSNAPDEAALEREERAASAAWVIAIRAHLHAEPGQVLEASRTRWEARERYLRAAEALAVRTALTPPANDQRHDTEPPPAPRDTEPTSTLPASGVQARSVMLPPPPSAPARRRPAP